VNEIIKEYNDCKNKKDIRKINEFKKEFNEKLFEELEDKIERGLNFLNQLIELKKELGEILSKNLEIREEIKALETLKQYHDENKHYFCTLSVSDLIVFRTLMEIENENFNVDHIKDPDKKSIYEKFITIAKKHMNSKKAKVALRRAGSKGYGDYYKQCYEYKSKDELKKLGKHFYDIHKVASIIKREFNKKHPYEYSEVMQDFGDNIRRCDDPFGKKKHPIWGDSSYRLAKGIAQMIYVLYKTKQDAFFIVDSLRNPYEVIYLRREFANFYLLSLYADNETRRQRVINAAAWKLGREFPDSL